MRSRIKPRVAVAFNAALLFALGLVALLGPAGSTVRPLGADSPGARFEPPNGRVYLGVSTNGPGAALSAWDSAAGITTHPALYGQWTTPDGSFSPILANAASRPGMTPVVHWNLPMQNGQITSGSEDSYIRAQAAAVKAFGAPVFVRLDWEMNGFWYPDWNLQPVTPVQYIAAWRHVVALFAAVPNVAFVWCPNVLDYFSPTGARTPTSAWYPGDDVVSWVGLDAYPQSAPATDLLNDQDGMNQMAAFAAAHHKPMMLAEWAPNTPFPDTADPINLVFDWAARYPATVKALEYFDFITQGKDYTLADHPVGAATFRARTVGKPNFLLHLVNATPPPPPTTTTVPSSTTTSAAPTTTVPQSTTTAALATTTTSVPSGATPLPVPTPGAWVFNRAASMPGGVVQLTTAAAEAAGSVFYSHPVESAGLRATFTVAMGSGSGGDGMTFALADATTNPSTVGGTGSGLGWAGIPGTAVGLATAWSTANPHTNSVGLITSTASNGDPVWADVNGSIPSLRSGPTTVSVAYNAGTLTVAIDGIQAISAAISLPPTVLVGFTAATGQQTDIHTLSQTTIVP